MTNTGTERALLWAIVFMTISFFGGISNFIVMSMNNSAMPVYDVVDYQGSVWNVPDTSARGIWMADIYQFNLGSKYAILSFGDFFLYLGILGTIFFLFRFAILKRRENV